MLRRMFGGSSETPPMPAGRAAPVPAVDAALAHLEAGRDTFAIFDVGHSHYVQVSVTEAGLYGEAVSNAYLFGDERLDDRAIEALVHTGWSREHDPNHSRTWRHWKGAHRARVVDDIVGTLVVVYDMPINGPVDVTTGR